MNMITINTWSYNHNDSLTHFGVLGMRWGRRNKSTSSSGLSRGQTMSDAERKKLGLLENDEEEFNNDVKLAKKHGGLQRKVKVYTDSNGVLKSDTVYLDHKNREVNEDYGKAVNAEANPRKAAKDEKREKKQLVKDQKVWDAEVQANWYKAYNEVSEYANDTLIPKINEKYKDYDFGDPKNNKAYEQYDKEYQEQFDKMYAQKLTELFGERPT